MAGVVDQDVTVNFRELWASPTTLIPWFRIIVIQESSPTSAMLRPLFASRHVVSRPFLRSRYAPPVLRHPQIRRNTTIADEIIKPISEAPESIQEETIKGILLSFQ